eukprot:1139789-Pelagomonas_calceolata.AAC.3
MDFKTTGTFLPQALHPSVSQSTPSQRKVDELLWPPSPSHRDKARTVQVTPSRTPLELQLRGLSMSPLGSYCRQWISDLAGKSGHGICDASVLDILFSYLMWGASPFMLQLSCPRRQAPVCFS